MRQAKVDWQLVKYGGAVHSYTERDAGDDPTRGAAYNEKADEQCVGGDEGGFFC